MKTKRLKLKLVSPLSILSVFLTLFLWYSLSEDGLKIISAIKFPPPTQVFESIEFLGFKIFTDIFATSARVLFGLIVGTILGCVVGAMIVFSRRTGEFLNPIIEGSRPVPVIAMIPFFLMWFGIEEPGKLFLVTIGVFMIVVVNVSESIRNVPKLYIQAAQTLGASTRIIRKRIIFPAIIPALIGPLRVAVALTFTLVVAAEFMGAQNGIGYRILEARRLFYPQVILLGIIQLGILASIFDAVLQRTMGRITRWSGRESK
ncbi:MAG: ABC transporter permease [Actinomycetota bacterium]|nr:ABC transporter permease [Actinomycetota bacterium]